MGIYIHILQYIHIRRYCRRVKFDTGPLKVTM
jgi:hypothetical protein